MFHIFAIATHHMKLVSLDIPLNTPPEVIAEKWQGKPDEHIYIILLYFDKESF